MRNFLFLALVLAVLAGCSNDKPKKKTKATHQTQTQKEELVLPDLDLPKPKKKTADKCQNEDVIKNVAASKFSLPYKNGIVIYRDVTCEESTITHHYEFDLPEEAKNNINEIEDKLRSNLVLKSNELLELYCQNKELEWYRKNQIAMEWHYTIPCINEDLASIVIGVDDCK